MRKLRKLTLLTILCALLIGSCGCEQIMITEVTEVQDYAEQILRVKRMLGLIDEEDINDSSDQIRPRPSLPSPLPDLAEIITDPTKVPTDSTEIVTDPTKEPSDPTEIVPDPSKLPTDTTDEPTDTAYGNVEHGYYYDHLGEAAQVWYQDIYEILVNRQLKVKLNSNYLAELGTEALETIYYCVLMDHPEIFYVSGYDYSWNTAPNGTVTSIEFSGKYDWDDDEIKRIEKIINDYTDTCLSGIKESASDYEKVKYVYEYLINHTTYNLDSLYNQSIYSVCAYGESVCQGYAEMAQYLLNKLGVETSLVQGLAGEDRGRHAWNLVFVDGYYYYLDVTWGDCAYTDEKGNHETLKYDYLCVTTEELCRTHEIDEIVPMPDCTATYSNYYMHEGAYFKSFDEAKLRKLVDNAIKVGRNSISLKCSNSQLYNEMFRTLFIENKMFDYLPEGTENITYFDDDIMLTFTILFRE